MGLAMPLEVRLRDAAVPLRHFRLTQIKRDVPYEILVDFYASDVMSEFPLWTSITDWMRVKIGAGAYSAVGDTLGTAVDLGSFTAGEIKEGTIEVKVPAAADVRQDELALNLGEGI